MAVEYQGSVGDGGGNALSDIRAVDVVSVGGKVFAVVGGTDSRLDVYEIDNDPASPTYGQLSATPVDTELDTASLNLNGIRAIESLVIDGTTFVFAGGSDNGISSFTIDGTGQLTPVDNATDTSSINMEHVNDLSTVSVDDGAGGMNHFVFVAADGAGGSSVDDDGVSVFQVAADGTMTNVDNVIAGGTNRLNNPQDVEAIQVDDGAGGLNTFIVAGGNQDGVSVFSVASDGTLTLTDTVLDDATMSLANVRSIEGFEIGGTSYVVVGADEGGVSFFEIDAAGTLTNVGNVADDASLNLAAIDDVYVGPYQGAPVMWVAGRDAGLDAYEIVVDGGTGQIGLTRIAEFDSATYDTSDMRGLDGDSGFIVAGDTDGGTLSSLTAPCFARGTRLLTPSGEVPVEDLRVGDRVLTRDRGAQRTIWIGRREIDFTDPANPRGDKDKPIEIKAGALGRGLPRRDLIVSPQHRMVLIDETGGEVLALAKGLTGLPGVRRMAGRKRVTYYALLLDHHAILLAEGAPTESFRPGPYILSTFPPHLRDAIHAVLPGLAADPERALGPPARPILSRRDVEALVPALRQRLSQDPHARPTPHPTPRTLVET